MNKLESIPNRWDQIHQSAEEYDYYNLFQPHSSLEKVDHFFKQHRARTVLDVGCGTGENAFVLNQKGYQVTAIDQSPAAIKRLRKKASDEKISVDSFVAQFQSLPFSDSSFDAVIGIQALHHGHHKNVEKAIEELKRITRKKGIIFITVPGRTSRGSVRYSLIKTARKISEHVYLPTTGKEKGIPHFIFNKKLIHKMFARFQVDEIWQDERDYYCFFGVKK